MATHQVTNQPPPLSGRNLFEDNLPLVEALEREGGGWATERASEVGRFWGGEPMQWGELANERPPVLARFNRYGERIDEVTFDDSWHKLMAAGIRDELHALPWRSNEQGANVARGALFITATQAEAGFACPTTMTFAAVPALRAQPELAAEWEPLLTATSYDPSSVPAAEKGSAICGMAMTEKQGGSDVRANTTTATPLNGGGPGAEYEITGHKWFCSAPMSDLFLVLAQAPEGISCFAMPRILPDGSRNKISIEQLKEKLGNRSNASSEVEYDGAIARMVGEPGRGVPTIIEMVAHTRLDCVLGAAAGMRTAVAQATWHAAHRAAFGKQLIDQPLMTNVLADLALESEAATVMAMRLARAYDEAEGDPAAAQFKRLATAVSKYYVCQRAPQHAFEAMEVLGGAGYVEQSGMPRLYREAPLNSIWEGSGNVIALDVLRALRHEPASLEGFFTELDRASGADARLDSAIARLRSEFESGEEIEFRARTIVEQMAIALQAALLVQHGPSIVSEAFCAARLSENRGLNYGGLPSGIDAAGLVARHTPRG
jgi:putative acyl-CoA dehydrogenase